MKDVALPITWTHSELMPPQRFEGGRLNGLVAHCCGCKKNSLRCGTAEGGSRLTSQESGKCQMRWLNALAFLSCRF
jgi:hypothetical protein